MPWTEESPLAAGFGAAAGFLNGMQNGQQQQAEAKRQAALDQEHAQAISVAQQHTAAQERAEQAKEEAATAKEAAADRRAGVGLDLSKVIAATPKPVKGSKPQDPFTAQALTLMAKAQAAEDAGASDAAKSYREQAVSLMNIGKSQAQTGEVNARTTLLGSEDWNLRHEKPKEFAERLAATEKANKAALGARYAIARERIQGELQRAGMSHGRTGEGAEMAMQKWMTGMNYSAAVRSTMDDYNQQMSDYRTGQRDNEQAAKFNAANPDAPQLPQVNLTMPSAPQVPIIIMTPQGPQVVQPPKPKTPPVARPPIAAAPPPAAPPAQGNGFMDWLKQHVPGMGGGGAPAAPSGAGKVVRRADAIRIGAQRGLTPDAAVRDAQAHGYTVQ